jgi:hypothetical protein
MSQVRANTVSNQAGTGSPDITGGELSRARTNLNGTGTIAARDDFNVSSYTDNGTGDYTMTFATAFPNANYSPVGAAILLTAARHFVGDAQTTAALRFGTWGTSTRDDQNAAVAIFGDRP